MSDLSNVRRAFLPPALVIDKSILNLQHSYEDYLLEFVNRSQVFLTLSKGEQYCHIPPDKQNNGECDCVSKAYSLDFKIFGSTSSLYARKNLTWQRAIVDNGITITIPPIQSQGMDATIIVPALKEYSYTDLLSINSNSYTFDRNTLSIESDIKGILKTVSCKKNILLLHNDFFFSVDDMPIDEIAGLILSHLNKNLAALFEFREKTVPSRDTFFAYIVERYLCIGQIIEGQLINKEMMPLKENQLFLKIAEYLATDYKKHFGIE